MKKLLFFLPLFTLLACGNNATETPETSKTDTVKDGTAIDTPVPAQKTCYAWIQGKDTIWMSLEQTGSLVTGELDYRWFEKDSNHGTVKGEQKGDTLVLDYTFMAEGMESVRKEFFLKKGHDYVIGEIDYEHDEEPYEARDARYTGETLVPVSCK